MKILAVSNVEGCTDRIVDAFEDSEASIVAKEESGGLEDLEDKLSGAMGKGIYEYAIVMVDDYVGATVAFNKLNSIRAAVCDSADDLELAINNKVNVIIVKTSTKKLDYLADGMIQESRPEKKAKPEKAPEAKKPEQRTAKQEPEEEDEDEEDDSPRSSGKGFLGKLKDQLGIIEDEGKK